MTPPPFQQTDVSDADQVQALVDFAVERFGGLHVMFNNAGVASAMKRFLHDDLERLQPRHERQPASACCRHASGRPAT